MQDLPPPPFHTMELVKVLGGVLVRHVHALSRAGRLRHFVSRSQAAAISLSAEAVSYPSQQPDPSEASCARCSWRPRHTCGAVLPRLLAHLTAYLACRPDACNGYEASKTTPGTLTRL
jgi:hypothetical protein